MTPEGILVETKERGAETVARVMGSETNAPVWLKLERKEGRIYAYESVDGVNWTLVASVVLALNTPYQLGMSAAAQQDVQTQLSEVSLNVSEEDETVLFSEEKLLLAEGISERYIGSIRIANPDYSDNNPCPPEAGFCDNGVGFYKGVLKADANLAFRVVEAPETSLKGMVPIGNKVIAEIPLDAVNLETEDYIGTLVAPSFPGAYEAAIGDTFAKMGITMGDGREYITIRNYTLGNSIRIHSADIRLALARFDLPHPEVLRISVLPVRRQTSNESELTPLLKTLG